MSSTGTVPLSASRLTDPSPTGAAPPRSTAIASSSRPSRVSRRASIMSDARAYHHGSSPWKIRCTEGATVAGRRRRADGISGCDRSALPSLQDWPEERQGPGWTRSLPMREIGGNIRRDDRQAEDLEYEATLQPHGSPRDRNSCTAANQDRALASRHGLLHRIGMTIELGADRRHG